MKKTLELFFVGLMMMAGTYLMAHIFCEIFEQRYAWDSELIYNLLGIVFFVILLVGSVNARYFYQKHGEFPKKTWIADFGGNKCRNTAVILMSSLMVIAKSYPYIKMMLL